jgi:hypothetical protein
MPLTEQQRQEGTRKLIEEMFVKPNATAVFTNAQLKAAFDAADDWADSNAASYNSALPTTFRNNATNEQKAFLLGVLCMKRAGLI